MGEEKKKMSKKKIKPEPENPFDEEPEEEEPDKIMSQIVLGDVAISSRKSLAVCRKELQGLLKDNTIKNYLGIYNKRKLIGVPNYIG